MTALFRFAPGVVLGDERSIAGNTRDSDVRLKHLGFLDTARRPQELEATLRGRAMGLSLEGEPLLETWHEEPTPDHWHSLVMERVPPAAARVLVVARAPWTWGKVLHAWGKQEVVGWALPGGDARADELDAVFGGPFSRAELPYPDGYFDAVLLAEGKVALADVRPLLSEKGCVCVALPATEWTLDTVRALAEGWSIARLEGARHRNALTHYILVACTREELVAGLYDVPMPTLSACLIVKNEEKVLVRCLESVRGVADEIIVVDTGSTDRTVEIARKFGAKVYHAEWTHDFAAARNVSLSKATGDWILVLDADEVLDPASAPMLKKVLLSGNVPGRIRMYYLREINYLMKGDLAQESSEHQNMRLFPNRPDIRYVGRIHEQVKYIGRDPEAWKTMSPGAPEPDDGTLIERFTTPLLLHHYGYISEEWDRKDRDARNLALLQKAIVETPDDPFTHFNLGCHLAHMNEPEPGCAPSIAHWSSSATARPAMRRSAISWPARCCLSWAGPLRDSPTPGRRCAVFPISRTRITRPAACWPRWTAARKRAPPLPAPSPAAARCRATWAPRMPARPPGNRTWSWASWKCTPAAGTARWII